MFNKSLLQFEKSWPNHLFIPAITSYPDMKVTHCVFKAKIVHACNCTDNSVFLSLMLVYGSITHEWQLPINIKEAALNVDY